DNASTDESARFVRKRFPQTRVLELTENRGFAAACNRGAHDGRGSVVAFLNNDMRVDRAWLRELLAPLLANDDVAANSSRILSWGLCVLGYRVLYAPAAVAYHKGHATGSKLPAHQLRVLYERNALATLIKNYDDANLARVLPAALLLAGKRALVYGHVEDGPF